MGTWTSILSCPAPEREGEPVNLDVILNMVHSKCPAQVVNQVSCLEHQFVMSWTLTRMLEFTASLIFGGNTVDVKVCEGVTDKLTEHPIDHCQVIEGFRTEMTQLEGAPQDCSQVFHKIFPQECPRKVSLQSECPGSVLQSCSTTPQAVMEYAVAWRRFPPSGGRLLATTRFARTRPCHSCHARSHTITQRTGHIEDSLPFRLSCQSFCAPLFSQAFLQAVIIMHFDSHSLDFRNMAEWPTGALQPPADQDEHEHFKQCSLHRPAVTGLSPTTLIDNMLMHRTTDYLSFDLFALIHCPNVFAIASQRFTTDFTLCTCNAGSSCFLLRFMVLLFGALRVSFGLVVFCFGPLETLPRKIHKLACAPSA